MIELGVRSFLACTIGYMIGNLIMGLPLLANIFSIGFMLTWVFVAVLMWLIERWLEDQKKKDSNSDEEL